MNSIIGYTKYTVRDGCGKWLTLLLCVANALIVRGTDLRKKKGNYRGFYNLENQS